MIEHLLKVKAVLCSDDRTQLKIPSQATNTLLSNYSCKGMQKNFLQSNLALIAFLLFGFSTIFSSKPLYGQCTPTLSITGGGGNAIPMYCEDDNTEYILSVDVSPLMGVFSGDGVIDTNTTDNIAIFRPDSAETGSRTITFVVTQTMPGGSCQLSDQGSLTVMVNAVPDAGDDGVAFICNDGISNINLFTSLNGTPDATGTWNAISGVMPVGSNGTLGPVEIGTLGAGEYEYEYTINGLAPCPDSSATVTLTITDPPTTPTLMPITAICEGESASITLTGLADATYEIQYEIPDSVNLIKDTITSSSSTVTFSTLPLTLGGTFTVSGLRNISVTPSCVNAPIAVSETVTVTPSPSIQGRDTALCATGNFDLRLLIDSLTTIGDTMFFSDNMGNQLGSNFVITLTEGTFTYLVTDSVLATNCKDTTQITLNVFRNPDIVGKDTMLCEGSTLDLRDLITGDSVDVLEYGLSPDGYTFSSGPINFNAAGTFTYNIRDSVDAAGCVDKTQIIVTVQTAPAFVGRDTTICFGDSVDLVTLLTFDTPSDSLEFGTVYGVYGPQSDSLTGPLTTTTEYFIRDSTSNGCVDTAMITVFVSPQPNLVALDSTVCSGSTINLLGLVNRTMGGDTIEFANVSGVYDGSVDTIVVLTSDTVFYVRDTVLTGGMCADVDTINITVEETPLIQGLDATICSGDSLDLSTVVVRTVAGDSLEFGAMGGAFGVYGAQSDSLTGPLTSIGAFGYFVRDSTAAGCVDTAMITINVSPQPNLVALDSTVCSGSTINLLGLVNRTMAGDTIEFANVSGVYDGSVDTIVVLTSDTVFYVRDTVLTGGMCADVDTINITVVPIPLIQGLDATICSGDSLDLSTVVVRTVAGDSLEFGAMGGAFGVYGAQSDSLTGPLTSIGAFGYFVRDSTAAGCVDTAMITINVSPQSNILGKDTSVCAGEPVHLNTLISGTILDTLAYDTIGSSDYLLSNIQNPIVTTTYWVRDSSASTGCMDTAQITINIFTSPIADPITGPDKVCIDATMNLVPNPSSGSLTYSDTSWISDNPAIASVDTNGVVTGHIAGSTYIQYVITDTNGCQETSDSHLVYIFARPIAGDITGDTVLCEASTISVNPSASDGNTPYTFTWLSVHDTVATIDGSGIITAINPGATSIRYIVSDDNGCLDTSAYQVVTVDSFPTIDFTISDPDTTICAGDMVTFTGTGGVTYEFLVNNIPVAAPSASSTYQTDTLAHGDMVSVAVTNLTGCQDTSGVIVMKVDTIPNATLVADDSDNIIATGQPVIFTGTGGAEYAFSINNVIVQDTAAIDTFAINTLNDKDTVMVEVFDGNTCSDTAMIVMTVNAPPIAVNDTIYILEDALPTNILVQANDSDPEGDILTTTIAIPADHGSSTVINNDSISYMPNPDFNGIDSIDYFILDTGPNVVNARVYIIVESVNDMPLASNDTLRITEDDPISIIDVQVNDVDVDGDSLITSIITMPGRGSASVMMDSIAYTPMPDSSGVDVIAYQVCDTAGLCGVAIIFIEIAPVNDRPVAHQDSMAIPEDSMNVAVAILANDFDADGAAFTLDTVHNPVHGSIVLTNDTVVYTPPLNFTGLDSIQYSICDTALCDTTFLIFNVLPINESPLAVKDSVTVLEDTTDVKIAFLANDVEVDDDAIILDSLFTSSLGITGTLTNDTLCYTPPANFNGLDSLKYIITDGVFKDSTYIIINVLAVNDAPIAVNDTVTVPENANPAIIAVQANDSDPDGHLFATSLVSGPTNGSATVSGGNVNYTPPMSFNGMDTISYRICDTQIPSACDTAFIFITVLGVNDAPVAVNDTIYLAEDTMAVLIPIESNDFDIDGDPTTISILTAATQSLVDSIRNDTLVYQPALNYVGLDSIQYQLFDGTLADQGKVYIFISPRNDAPITMRDSVTVLEDASNVQIAVTANDSDVDAGDSLIASIVVMPTSGGTASIIDDTMLVYNPASNFNGIDTIVYQVCDTSMVCTQDTVIATVQSVNDKPIAVDDFMIVNEDTSNVIIDVQVNDSDGDGETFTTFIISSTMTVDTLDGDSIIVTPPADFTGVQLVGYKICDPSGLCDTGIVTVTVLPVNDAPVAMTNYVAINQDTTNVGIAPIADDTDIDDVTLTLSGTPTASNGLVTLLGMDSISYTPTSGFSGIDTIVYVVCDTSMACVNGMVIVTVGFVNTPPVAMNDVVPAINEDGGAVMVNVLLNDADINGPADTLKVANITTPNSGVATIVGDSTISYTPDLNFNGADTVQYTVCDTSGGCAIAQVYFTITSVNDKPVAVNDTVSLTRDTMGAVLAVESNDSDVDGDATIVTPIGSSTQGVVLTVSNDSIVYTANSGFVGVDTVTYELSDGTLKDTALLIVVILDPNNVVPVASPDMATTVPNMAIHIDVQDNDVDGNGDNLTTSIVSAPNALNTVTVQNGDSILYTPSISFAGFDTLRYQVCDISLTCDTAMVVIDVRNTLQISAKVFLEGPYNGGTVLMHDSLRKLNLIPAREPYSTLPNLVGAYKFVHKHGGGNEVVTDSVTVFGVTGPNAIVDWVYLELLTDVDTLPIASRSALLQRDGDIVEVDGISPVRFEYLPDSTYFLSIRHRNHLGVMSNTKLPFSTTVDTLIDFTNTEMAGGTKAWREDITDLPMDTILSRLVLWAGDGNADRKVIYDGIANDRDPVFFDVITDPLNINSNYNHVAKGYYRGDYDMKGSSVYIGTGNDPDVIFFNVFLHQFNSSGSTIFIIREQILR